MRRRRRPQRAGVPVADIITGMYASIAICAALVHRAESGAGQHLDLALLDSADRAPRLPEQQLLLSTGSPPKRIGNLHPNIVPYQPFRTKDGSVILACGNDNLYPAKFCEVGRLPRARRRCALRIERQARREPRGAVAAAPGNFPRKDHREWVELLDARRRHGPINDVAPGLPGTAGPRPRLKIELEHPGRRKLPLVASPMRFSGTPLEHSLAPPTSGSTPTRILREVLKLGEPEIASCAPMA